MPCEIEESRRGNDHWSKKSTKNKKISQVSTVHNEYKVDAQSNANKR